MEIRTFRIGNGREFYSHVAIIKVGNLYFGDNFSEFYGKYTPQDNTVDGLDLIGKSRGDILWEYAGEDFSDKGNYDKLEGYFAGKGKHDLWEFRACTYFK